MNDVFKALADPTRRRILEILSEQSRNAGEIADAFSISKPSISHHLSILKSAGLIQDERQGQNILYSLNTTIFQDIVKWFFDMTQSGQGTMRLSEANGPAGGEYDTGYGEYGAAREEHAECKKDGTGEEESGGPV
ncbi:MAG: winged helix-turn-helix transcriptional regulator [Lachnospiraceae bacterium]|nr:winged helix-turn-helix transcriptional regulator [Lachnospiraceae bacterium]